MKELLTFTATKYYSEKKGELELKYPILVHITEDGGYVTYKARNGRDCRMLFYLNTNGYYWTSIRMKDNTKMSCRINRLVYSNLIGDIPLGMQVDHIDRNRLNNLPSNLRILSATENNLNRKDMTGENNPFSKITITTARAICSEALQRKIVYREIAKKYNVSYATVKLIARGIHWANYTKDIRSAYSKQIGRCK